MFTKELIGSLYKKVVDCETYLIAHLFDVLNT